VVFSRGAVFPAMSDADVGRVRRRGGIPDMRFTVSLPCKPSNWTRSPMPVIGDTRALSASASPHSGPSLDQRIMTPPINPKTAAPELRIRIPTRLRTYLTTYSPQPTGQR